MNNDGFAGLVHPVEETTKKINRCVTARTISKQSHFLVFSHIHTVYSHIHTVYVKRLPTLQQDSKQNTQPHHEGWRVQELNKVRSSKAAILVKAGFQIE